MKRLITLSLAALMVLSLSAVAFASLDGDVKVDLIKVTTAQTNAAGVKGLLEDSPAYVSLRDVTGDPNEDEILVTTGGNLSPGWTLYIPLVAQDGSTSVDSADAVKNLKIKTKALTGAEYVDSFRIEYKKVSDNPSYYAYFLAIKTKDRADTGVKNVGYEITLSKSSGEDKNNVSYKFESSYNVGFTINFARIKTDFFRFPITLNYNYSEKSPDSEMTIEFQEADGVYFEVDMFQQGRIIAAFNAAYNAEIAAKFPEANIDFYNGNGAIFAKIGVLTIPAEDGMFLYVQDENGMLVAVDAEYDSAEEAFKVNTRVLGKYAVSDVELDLSVQNAPEGEPTPEAPAEVTPDAPVKENVNTGAAA